MVLFNEFEFGELMGCFWRAYVLCWNISGGKVAGRGKDEKWNECARIHVWDGEQRRWQRADGCETRPSGVGVGKTRMIRIPPMFFFLFFRRKPRTRCKSGNVRKLPRFTCALSLQKIDWFRVFFFDDAQRVFHWNRTFSFTNQRVNE